MCTAGLLLDPAQNALEGDTADGEPDGRIAVVARRFVQTHLEDRDARGITDGDRLPLEQFEAVVNYAPVPTEELVEPVEAD